MPLSRKIELVLAMSDDIYENLSDFIRAMIDNFNAETALLLRLGIDLFGGKVKF